MQKILISACLVGEKCNYKGEGKYNPNVEKLKEKYELVLFCPEVEGGLKTPRVPSEIKGSQVVMKNGKVVTRNFELGANKALALCQYLGITKAVLKENSPSCGTHMIHNGYFMDRLIPGMGITARLLKSKGIEVYSEDEIDKLL
mgnify:FL=1